MLNRCALVLLLTVIPLGDLEVFTALKLLRQSSTAQSSSTPIARKNPTIFVRTKSAYFKPATLESELLKRSEIQARGFVITRDEVNADYVIEVDRKLFTTKFVFSVLDARSNTVVMSGKVSSIGGTVEHKIADKFVKRLEAMRSLPANVK